MEDRPSSYISIAVIIAAALLAIFLAVLLAGNPRSEFEEVADFSVFEKALDDRGLSVCVQREINWTKTPGFVSGRFYDISANCSTFDPNRPEARAWVAEFDSLEARDAALANFETSRRHIGSGLAWSKGPLVILVEGSRKTEVIDALKKAVSGMGAKEQSRKADQSA